MWIMGAFASMALLLSAIGIYGVMSYLVSRRTRELGIRMALGANRREIVRLIVGGGARLIAVGIVLGAVASMALQKVMGALIYNASILDGATAVAIVSLAASGLLRVTAALRAARVDPLVALRADEPGPEFWRQDPDRGSRCHPISMMPFVGPRISAPIPDGAPAAVSPSPLASTSRGTRSGGATRAIGLPSITHARHCQRRDGHRHRARCRGHHTIRVGAGGIMLPNHAPLVVAEQFGTLESLYPGRIDLGLGRAPGSDQATARALRRTLHSDPDAFPQDVLELMAYFHPEEGQIVRAVPGAGLDVPIWFWVRALRCAGGGDDGLPFAFASNSPPR